MIPSTLLSALWHLAIVSQAYASPSHVASEKTGAPHSPKRQASPYLTEKSARFLVNGTNFPYVPFDIGESYGGLLPISSKENDTQQLYFWFFPSDNPEASDEITIWLNGGPGCSSLIGLLTENGKFLLQEGTTVPVANDWSWTKLTNVVWIDQPVGAGFSQGEPTAFGTDELAVQFVGFWKNFIDTFNMKGRKIYLTGESYAGVYIPYFAAEMLAANDTDYYNVQGTMLIDPAITDDVSLVEIPMLAFAEANQALLRFNSTFRSYMRELHAEQNYTSFFSQYFTFPSSGPMPIPPNVDENYSPFRSTLQEAALLINPCFNVYHILDYCPFLHSAINVFDDTKPELGPFFNLTEVQDAMNAPRISWLECSGPVYAGTGADQATAVSYSVLPKVFDGVPLNIVANGALDMLIPSVGTLFALQNTTWGGTTGFDAQPNRTFIVPSSTITYSNGDQQYLGPAGEMGTWGYERGVVFVDVAGAGHELPGYNPSAAFRLLEVLLGRVGVEEGLGGGAAWTTQPGTGQVVV